MVRYSYKLFSSMYLATKGFSSSMTVGFVPFLMDSRTDELETFPRSVIFSRKTTDFVSFEKVVLISFIALVGVVDVILGTTTIFVVFRISSPRIHLPVIKSSKASLPITNVYSMFLLSMSFSF